ncbi:hypothetical protein EMIT093MI4_30444 [Pseudomonas sp. IT-93MI4]
MQWVYWVAEIEELSVGFLVWPLAPSLASQLPQGYVRAADFVYDPVTVGAGLPAMRPE